MYINIYIYIHTSKNLIAHKNTSTPIHASVLHFHTSIHIQICLSEFCTYSYIFKFVYICMCLYIYVYIYSHVHDQIGRASCT